MKNSSYMGNIRFECEDFNIQKKRIILRPK